MKFKIGDKVITRFGKGVIVYSHDEYYLVSHYVWREGHNNEHVNDYKPKYLDKRHWYFLEDDMKLLKTIN